MNNTLRKLHQEKNALLEEWQYSYGKQRVRILVRIMDIDDELSEAVKVGVGRSHLNENDPSENPSYSRKWQKKQFLFGQRSTCRRAI